MLLLSLLLLLSYIWPFVKSLEFFYFSTTFAKIKMSYYSFIIFYLFFFWKWKKHFKTHKNPSFIIFIIIISISIIIIIIARSVSDRTKNSPSLGLRYFFKLTEMIELSNYLAMRKDTNSCVLIMLPCKWAHAWKPWTFLSLTVNPESSPLRFFCLNENLCYAQVFYMILFQCWCHSGFWVIWQTLAPKAFY